MAMFYDQSEYLFVDQLDDSEVFIHYQDNLSKTATISQIKDDLFVPILDAFRIDDIVDVEISNENNGEILGLSVGYWRNISSSVPSLSDLNDVVAANIDDGHMLAYHGLDWSNSQHPTLKTYYESEYDIGTLTGTYTIDLSNGNVQKITLTGDITISLPVLPSLGKFWNITLKVVGDGIHTPLFNGLDSNIIWCSDITPMNTGGTGSTCIYVFMSDTVSSQIYGTLSWREE